MIATISMAPSCREISKHLLVGALYIVVKPKSAMGRELQLANKVPLP